MEKKQGEIYGTWISRTRLWPLNAKAIIPSELRTSKNLSISFAPRTGLYVMPGNLSLLTETIHIIVQYTTAVMDPISDTPAIEFKFGNWDRRTAALANTKYHSTGVNVLTVHDWPHTVWKNNFDVDPPIMFRATHVPIDRYRIGNRPSHFAFFSPELLKKPWLRTRIVTENKHAFLLV